MQHFTPKQLQEHLEQNQTVRILLDVREPWEYETCHIENSILIPMGKIPQQLDELDKELETIVICHHGVRSQRVAMYLEHYGFNNVINLSGGVEAWALDVEPEMPRY